jgi:hypothetical protein
MPKTEEFLIDTADRCKRITQEGRGLLDRLEAITDELMAKAVDLDTDREKKEGSRGPDDAG